MAEVKRRDAIQGDIVHEYDGIEEADNRLPTWWVAGFIFTIVFGMVYWFVYHEYHLAELPNARFKDAMAALEIQRAREAGADLSLAVKDPALIKAGQGLFAQYCVPCHGEKGQGKIGPNLTDTMYLHGGSARAIHDTIEKGVGAKGMPSWGPVLGPVAVKQATAFVVSLRGTNVPGREPQGEPWDGTP